jgi:hypothetical protein
MSTWIAAGLLLNVGVVVAAVVLAIRLAGPRPVDGALAARAELRSKRRPTPPAAPSARPPPLPPLNPTETRRVEWLALLAAFNSAQDAYVRELAAWHAPPRRYGALSRAKHALTVARERLSRFERERVLGSHERRAAAQPRELLRSLTPN